MGSKAERAATLRHIRWTVADGTSVSTAPDSTRHRCRQLARHKRCCRSTAGQAVGYPLSRNAGLISVLLAAFELPEQNETLILECRVEPTPASQGVNFCGPC